MTMVNDYPTGGPVSFLAGNPVKKSPEPVLTPEAALLMDAIAVINGERQDQYGEAEDSFDDISLAWTGYIRAAHRKDVSTGFHLNGKDIALLMAMMKAIREGHAPKRDNRLDGAGYFGLSERIVVRQK